MKRSPNSTAGDNDDSQCYNIVNAANAGQIGSRIIQVAGILDKHDTSKHIKISASNCSITGKSPQVTLPSKSIAMLVLTPSS